MSREEPEVRVRWWSSTRSCSARSHAHFVERHGLVVLVAIGESVVAIGIGLAGLELALELAGGAAIFLLGDVLFRRTLGIGAGRWRAAAALAVLATIPLGLGVAAAAQMAALVALLVVALVAEPAPAPAAVGGR